MRQIMCVRLRQWPIDRARRKSRRDDHPLVLVRTVASRPLVAFANQHARVSGIAIGMTLAEAKALCSGLVHQEDRPDKDLAALHSLARWMVRFSPVVSVEAPDALFLDVTGSDRLFSGLHRLMGLASESLTRFKLHHGIAIAPTPAAAIALASTGSPRIVTLDQLPGVLSPLPIFALRLGNELNQAFHALGVESIGQLMQLPRETLPARFGASVLARLDQAMGKTSQPLVQIAHSQPIIARMEFEGSVDSLSDLLQAVKYLLREILHQLHQRVCGARTLVLDFQMPGQPPVSKTIHFSRPTADLASLWNLLRCATETVKSGEDGFAGLRMSVPVFEPITTQQLNLLEHEAQIAEGVVDHLIQRLRIRLGETVVLFPRPVESHLPEKAVRFDKDASPFSERECKPRPLHLLPEPVEVRCALLGSDRGEDVPISFTHGGEAFHLVHCNGPERITGSWWEGRNKTRDYFDVEDRGGQRFWLFQVSETRKWYLHGE